MLLGRRMWVLLVLHRFVYPNHALLVSSNTSVFICCCYVTTIISNSHYTPHQPHSHMVIIMGVMCTALHTYTNINTTLLLQYTTICVSTAFTQYDTSNINSCVGLHKVKRYLQEFFLFWMRLQEKTPLSLASCHF